MIVEELEMPVLIRGDLLAYQLQHRLRGRLGKGGVVAAGPGLDHATGNQLPGA